MTVHLRRQLFTVSDYYKMVETGILSADDKVELLNGEIIKMSPIKSPHSSIVEYLRDIIPVLLPETAQCRGQNPIIINDKSEPEPDLVIVKKRKDRYKKKHPSVKDIFLLIEVSDSTLEKDRSVKKEIYAKANIPEYWIINIPNQQVEVFSKPEDGIYLETKILKKGKLNFELFEETQKIKGILIEDLF